MLFVLRILIRSSILNWFTNTDGRRYVNKHYKIQYLKELKMILWFSLDMSQLNLFLFFNYRLLCPYVADSNWIN